MNHDMSSTSGHSSGGVISQVDDKVCSKGYVYLNNQCTLCTSNPAWIKIANEWRMYCSGVTKGQLLTNPNGPLVNQQLTKCPNGSWPNDKLDDCVCAYGGTMKNGKCEGMKLSKKDLYYGPKGAAAPLYKQCWTKTTDNAYKVCMGFDNDITGNIFWSSGDNSINNTTTANQANGNTTSVSNNTDVNSMGTDDDCGYAVLGRDDEPYEEEYIFDNVLKNTDLGNRLIKVKGAGNYTGELAAIKAVKSSLSNTPDGCICPLEYFKYNGNNKGLFYTWDNDIKKSIEKMNEINSGVKLNQHFACLLNTNNIDGYSIAFRAGCQPTSVPDRNHDKWVGNVRTKDPDTYTKKPRIVSDVCPASSKKRWKCKPLLKVNRVLYLDPSKTFQQNEDLVNYIKQYGAEDSEYVRRGLQHYGKNRESELIEMFCVPSD